MHSLLPASTHLRIYRKCLNPHIIHIACLHWENWFLLTTHQNRCWMGNGCRTIDWRFQDLEALGHCKSWERCSKENEICSLRSIFGWSNTVTIYFDEARISHIWTILQSSGLSPTSMPIERFISSANRLKAESRNFSRGGANDILYVNLNCRW